AQRYVRALDDLGATLQAQRTQVLQDGAAQSSQAKWLAAGTGLCMALLGALLSRAVIRSITQPLAAAVQLAQTIAAGDLSQVPHSQRRDDLGQLTQALAQMTLQLRTLVGQVQGGVEAVAAASNQMAQDNHALSD